MRRFERTFQRTGEAILGGETAFDEGEHLRRSLAGDRDAFDTLVREFYPRVRATALRLVGNPEDADDLAQECFVRAHRALQWFRGDASFGAWLRRIVVHLARDRFRSQGRRPERAPLSAAENVPSFGEPTLEIGRRELERRIRDGLDALPERLRIPLVLRTLEGLGYDEIAQTTGVTPATARTQVMKARKALWRWMGPDLDPHRSKGD